MNPKIPLTSLMLMLLVLGGLAVAGIDYHLGTGQDGDLVVSGTKYMDEVRSPVTGDNPVGTKFIYIRDTAAFKAGNEILIISSQKTGVGQYETKNITSISDARLYLDRPLTYSYGVDGVHQVVKVPHYRDVTVKRAGVITCHNWDGLTGGSVFFRASGVVDVHYDGGVTANGCVQP